MPALLLLAWVLLDATVQGLLLRVLREWAPMSTQPAIDMALHRLWPLGYVLLAVAAGGLTYSLVDGLGFHPLVFATAGLLRLALFDVVLVWVRDRRPSLGLGTSAASDGLLSRVPGWAVVGLRVVALGVSLWITFL